VRGSPRAAPPTAMSSPAQSVGVGRAAYGRAQRRRRSASGTRCSLGARSVGGDRRRASGVASSRGASASARQQGDRGRHGAATPGQMEENPDLPAPCGEWATCAVWRVGVRVHHRPRSGGAWAEEGGAAWRGADGAWARSLGARRSLGTRVPQRVCQRGGCSEPQSTCVSCVR
jgi:hypothetical protein